jgi:hypothetical protein
MEIVFFAVFSAPGMAVYNEATRKYPVSLERKNVE